MTRFFTQRWMILSRRGVFGLMGILPALLFGAFPAQAEDGAALVRKNGCVECHRFSPDASLAGRRGPDLFFAGDKFQEPWLLQWLQQPQPIRPAGYITDPGFLLGSPSPKVHSALGPVQAKAVTAYLMGLKLAAPGLEVRKWEPLSKGERFKFKILFERDYGCIACHQSVNLMNKPRGGVSGPSLIDAGDRLRADWVYLWLKEPQRFEPKGRMPRFDLEEPVRAALTRYVMWHQRNHLQ
ncbi:MAG: c-type cytochrome [Nitrospinaceae bacterium]